MSSVPTMPSKSLYDLDETAWLETTSKLVAGKRFSEIDHQNLSRYLAETTKRDRRGVYRRLVVLITHLLKWEQQPGERSASCRRTIREQRRELRLLFESKTLRLHAETVFLEVYAEARLQAADETGLNPNVFSDSAPWTLDVILADELEPIEVDRKSV